MNYRKINKQHWINLKTNNIFKTKTFKNKDGKSFNFLDTEEEFINGMYGLKYYLGFFDRTGIEKPRHFHNTEIIISRLTNDLKGKKVLILGAGPSSNEIDWKGEYDYIITSNNYFKKFSQDPYLITLTPYIPLHSKELQNFLDNSNCLIGIEPEFHKPVEQEKIYKFWKKYKKRIVFHHTRYCSAIGVSTRQAVFAVLLGASKVHLCGLDLFKDDNSRVHSFESIKDLQRWRTKYGIEFQNRQVIAFWEYLTKIAKQNNCEVKNIAENSEHNCMKFITRVKQ